MANKQLSPEAWMMAGFRALTTRGPAALKAESLARDLKTTKGSFYWHFKDVADFQTKMLAFWRARAYEQTVADLATAKDPKQKLIALGKLATAANRNQDHGGHATETAIRAWAQSNPRVRIAVDEIDRLRLDFVEGILAEIDKPEPEIARVIYGAYVGMESLNSKDGHLNAPALSALINIILARK